MSTKDIVISIPDLSDEQFAKVLTIIETVTKESIDLLGADKEKVTVVIQNPAKNPELAKQYLTNVRFFRNTKDQRLSDGMINPDYMRGETVCNPRAKKFGKTGTVVSHCYNHESLPCFIVRPTKGGEVIWLVSSCKDQFGQWR